MKCLECGHDLIEMRQELIWFVVDSTKPNSPWTHWNASHTDYAGHCKNCLCDWEWHEIFKDGKCTVSQPQRIFWG